MIGAVRQLALDFLYHELDGEGDAETWYRQVRDTHMDKLFPYLVEAPRESGADNYYVICPDPHDDEIAVLEQRVLKTADATKLPFVQSTGSQSPALGPVIKRSFQKSKGGGPSEKILDATIAAFGVIGAGSDPWSDYFTYTARLLARPKLRFRGEVLTGKPALVQAVEVVPETRTAYLSVLDEEGRLPGERSDYRAYLEQALAQEKYATRAALPVPGQRDALTGEVAVVYPNGLSGAGLNLSNVDRVGAFAGLELENAWKRFALSAASADLLYVFSFHMRGDFVSRIAGEPALVLPHLSPEQPRRQRFVRDFKAYLAQLAEDHPDASYREKRLLRRYQDHPEAVTSITLLWASFGQKLTDVTGMVTDILPSRLSTISDVVDRVNNMSSPVFPTYSIGYLEPDLGLNSLGALLKRPGGAKTKKINEGARLFGLKRDIAARVYHAQPLATERFWTEVLAVAKAYLTEAAEAGSAYRLLNEGVGKQGSYITLAGWVKHLARYIYFLRQLEVYPAMDDWHYVPRRSELQAFFQDSRATAGLDSPEKVYAFLLGVLFGKVMEVQGARGVNVGANALTWLRRMNISGADLPGLYVRIREKLLAYGTEQSVKVRAVVEELGHLGAQIGTPMLTKTEAGYYLLLGQSLSKTLVSSDKSGNKSGENREAIS